jgi:hypothetical protein
MLSLQDKRNYNILYLEFNIGNVLNIIQPIFANDNDKRRSRSSTYVTENTIKIQMCYFNVGRTECPYTIYGFV